MTTNRSKGRAPAAAATKTSAPPAAAKIEPGASVPPAAARSDLEARVKVRRVELVARLRELRAHSGAEAGEAGDRLKAKLTEVSHIIKDGVVDSWASLEDSVTRKLEHWLVESAAPRATRDVSAEPGQS